jgi:hypothetical protein
MCCVSKQDFDLVDAVARSLHISTPKELSQLGQTLFPAMLNTAVVCGDISKVRIGTRLFFISTNSTLFFRWRVSKGMEPTCLP